MASVAARIDGEPADGPGRVLGVVAQLLGGETTVDAVVLALHRRAWDDFEVAAVDTADEDLRASLVGALDPKQDWLEALGAGEFRPVAHALSPAGLRHLSLGREALDRHPDANAVAVPLCDREHQVFALFVVLVFDGVAIGRGDTARLRDAAALAGLALGLGREAAEERRHVEMLDRFLGATLRLSEELPLRSMLSLWCETARDLTGFQHVFAGLYDERRAAPGFRLSHVAGAGPAGAVAEALLLPDRVAPLLLPRFEAGGCALVPPEAAAAAFPELDGGAALAGDGPTAWRHHWLLVPLYGERGQLTGIARLGEPSDLLLPSQTTLRALRLFGNCLAAAVARRRLRRRQAALASRDPVLRLASRGSFTRTLAAELARARRYGHRCALVLVELDALGPVTREVGGTGTAALGAAAVLERRSRAGDAAFHLGGTEFALLLAQASRPAAEAAVARIRADLAALALPVRGGFGIAVAPDESSDVRELRRLARADLEASRRRRSRRRRAG
jgi:diguanylate cyclase (GGDEF)-like protein